LFPRFKEHGWVSAASVLSHIHPLEDNFVTSWTLKI
jgi:hypothetical protein